ncbi:MAG: hypothetical protein N3G78_07935 [Desulfobacterota bacterium]|nr:hypothetical protein [Thermodesulfobacteriota bacterium]
MRKRWALVALLGMFFLFWANGSLHAQKQPRSLTILYTNNINGEIEPCPT